MFVLGMHRRWGQPAPDSEYSSYTEEEFHRALDRFKQTGSPTIFVFFKHVDRASMDDPGRQLKKVLAFRHQLEKSRSVLYRMFADPKHFKEEVDRHLRAYVRGELPAPDAEPEPVVLPDTTVKRIEEAERQAKRAAERAKAANQRAEFEAARADGIALAFARQAAKAALEGKIEQARQAFAKATPGSNNLEVLYLAFEFSLRVGDLEHAEEIIEQWLSISGPDAETGDTAAAYGNLGVIHVTRGDLDQAERMHKKALQINERLGDQGRRGGRVRQSRPCLQGAREPGTSRTHARKVLGDI